MGYGIGPHDQGCDCWRCLSRRKQFTEFQLAGKMMTQKVWHEVECELCTKGSELRTTGTANRIGHVVGVGYFAPCPRLEAYVAQFSTERGTNMETCGLTAEEVLTTPNDVVAEKVLSAMKENADLVLVHFHGSPDTDEEEAMLLCSGYSCVDIDKEFGETDDVPEFEQVGEEVPCHIFTRLLYQGKIKLDSFVSGGHYPTEHYRPTK
jgi:hypothetical protein